MTTFGSIRDDVHRRVGHLPVSHQAAVMNEFTRDAAIDAVVEHPGRAARELWQLAPSLRFRTVWNWIFGELEQMTEENFLRVWGSVRRDLRERAAAEQGRGG